jgi:parallel beta-helix repeat protein
MTDRWHNRLGENRLSGNGYEAQGSNFGIGLVAPGTNDNVIEDNTIVGNTNGIVLVAGVEGNIIRRNVVAGNPPVQVSVSFPTDAGVDIKNLAAPDANTLRNNLCLTSVKHRVPLSQDFRSPFVTVGTGRNVGKRRSDRRSPRWPGQSIRRTRVIYAAFLCCHDREPDPYDRAVLVGEGGSSVSVRGCGQARRFARSHRSSRQVQQ